MQPFSRLQAIVDVDAAERAGWTPLDLLRAYLAGGARVVQLRAKTLAGGALLDLAAAAVAIAHARQAALIVNDRADIARLAGADGVHVGQEDLPPRAIRPIVGADAIVGLSTHTPAQVERALDEPIAYVAVGPVFGTRSKATGYAPVGLELVSTAAAMARARAAARGAPPVPVVAIGGITLESSASVIDAGAAAVAVIGDLLGPGDPDARVREYMRRLGEHV